jgi:hypothetical protein
MVFIPIDKHQVLMVMKYYTDSCRRSETQNRIVEEISRVIPEITDVDRYSLVFLPPTDER